MSEPTPLVLIHGFAGAPEAWEEAAGLLPPGISVHALRVGGHGRPLEVSSFAGEVDRLASVIHGRGAVGGHLAGYSMGGRLALGLLARHPGLAASATLIGAHPGIEDENERSRRRQADEVWARKLEDEGLEAFLDAWEAQPLFSTQSPAQRARQRQQREGLRARDLAAALRTLGTGSMPPYGWREALPVPVTWAYGALDERFQAFAQSMERRHAASRAIAVPEAGHNVVLERPAAVAKILATACQAPEDSDSSVLDPFPSQTTLEGRSR